MRKVKDHQTENHMLIILALRTTDVNFAYWLPYAILALSKWLFKGWRLKFRGFIRLRSCSRHCNWNWSALHKDEHKKDVKHKKLLNLLCIAYLVDIYNTFCKALDKGLEVQAVFAT